MHPSKTLSFYFPFQQHKMSITNHLKDPPEIRWRMMIFGKNSYLMGAFPYKNELFALWTYFFGI